MNFLTQLFGSSFRWVFQTTWQAAVLAGLIFAAQWLVRKRLSASWRYGLWMLLIIRLLMPTVPESKVSIFNLASRPLSQSVKGSPQTLIGLSPYTVVNSITGSPRTGIAGEQHESVRLPTPPGVVVVPAGKVDWFGIALCGWMAGGCFFGARLVWTHMRLRSQIVECDAISDEGVTRLFNECREALQIAEPVQLIESEFVESPGVYGFWRKWLLLPDGFVERFSADELRCIFLHELAHIKRRDLSVNWLISVLQVGHWFNPILRLAFMRMRADRELAADALALAHVGRTENIAYGETILRVVEHLTRRGSQPGLVGIAESKAGLRERLRAIARFGATRPWKWVAIGTVIALAGIGLTDAKQAATPPLSPGHKSEPAGAAVPNDAGYAGGEPFHYDTTPKAKTLLHGIVLLPDGRPAAGVQVGARTPENYLHVGDGEFASRNTESDVVRTAADGSFVAPIGVATQIYALDDRGFAMVPKEMWTNGVKIILQPCGRVEGTLRLNNRPGWWEFVHLEDEVEMWRHPGEGAYSANVGTSERGRFIFDHVPAGNYALSRMISMGDGKVDNGWGATNLTVRPGVTTKIIFGGNGRLVTGKFVWETNKEIPSDSVIEVNFKAPDSDFQVGPGEDSFIIQPPPLIKWWKKHSGQHFVGVGRPDGNFQVDDVTPGTYDMTLVVHGKSLMPIRGMELQSARIMVPSVPKYSDAEDHAPFDVGDVKVRFVTGLTR